ncbi:MAG: hypothetical protein ACJ786_05230 [Catenulispora sp.]
MRIAVCTARVADSGSIPSSSASVRRSDWLLFGHARGWAEDLRLPDGIESPEGVPNFVVADLGATPYAPVDQGGFWAFLGVSAGASAAA